MKFKLFLPFVLFLLFLPIAFSETALKLQIADTENLADGHVRSDSATTNFGSDATNLLRTPDLIGRSYHMFDISSIASGSNVTGANFSCKIHTASGAVVDIGIYHVNTTWEESVQTWNNQVCGTGFDDAGNCNLTAEDTHSSDATGWTNLSATRMVQQMVTGGGGNVSFITKYVSEGGTGSSYCRPKEYATAADRPILYIFYDAPSPLDLQFFTLTAKDTYDDTALTNITVSISNSSFSFNTSTVNGTIIINNRSISSFNKFYDIEFRINDTEGYFNSTFLNINISDTNSFQGSLFQSVLRLQAIDGLTNLTISDFTARTNSSIDSTTTGEILILIKKGNFQLNVTALGFDKLVTNFNIAALANNSLNVTMGSIFNFRLIREETNTPFDFNSTNSTDLTVFCPSETIRITFNTTNNISQTINCQFDLMQMTVDYGVLGSYFRTLTPPFSQKNITWYLIDLIAGDTAIQKIIRLVDLTGDFDNATLTVKRAIPRETTLKTMIEQKFDISNEVNLFLIKDALYTINIENEDEDIALGNLIPTEAGTQTITLPKIAFVPQETTLGDDISWSYTFNITLGILRLQYVDTTNLTTLVRFTVRNGSSPNLNQLFRAESDNNSTVTMTFNQVLANTTYVSELFFEHPGLSNFTETRPWYEFGGVVGALNLEGWSDIEQINFKKWFTWIFIFIWGMLWTRRYIGIGMTTLVIWLWIFKTLKWIDVSNLVFGFVALLAVVGWIVEAIKKE